MSPELSPDSSPDNMLDVKYVSFIYFVEEATVHTKVIR